jgi:hypothetical protein
MYKITENKRLLSTFRENLYNVLPELRKTVKIGGKSKSQSQVVYSKGILEFVRNQ